MKKKTQQNLMESFYVVVIPANPYDKCECSKTKPAKKRIFCSNSEFLI